jgi:hypothetical protein
MTHTLTTPTGKRLLIVTGLPEDAKEFEITDHFTPRLLYRQEKTFDSGNVKFIGRITLIFDSEVKRLSWKEHLKIIGKLSQLSDFSEYVEMTYKSVSISVEGIEPMDDLNLKWAKEEFFDFLESNGIEVDENALLIEIK